LRTHRAKNDGIQNTESQYARVNTLLIILKGGFSSVFGIFMADFAGGAYFLLKSVALRQQIGYIPAIENCSVARGCFEMIIDE